MRLQAISQSRTTTLTGSVATLSAIVISLIPRDVWDACSEAVQTSGSPLFTSVLLVAGISLTVIGPSLAPRSQERSSEANPKTEET